MQHQGRSGLDKYHDLLQRDHDFRVWADVLTTAQRYVGTLDLLDGQINFNDGSEGPDRTATISLSDPGGALDFGDDYLRDPKGVLWVGRLVQVWHEVRVPGHGLWQTSCIVGVPTAVARDGAEVGLELGDKSLLADHGVRPKTYKKGMRVDKALRQILWDTGERFMRIPTTKKTLSKSYTVGMGEDSLTPWQLFKRVAGAEMGWRAYYDGEGFAVAESTRTAKNPVVVRSLLSLPDSSTSLTELVNYSKVTSYRKPTNKKGKVPKDKKNVTLIHDSVAALDPRHDLSEQSLGRNGAPRTLPIVEVNSNLKNLRETWDRAVKNLDRESGMEQEKSFEIIPFFHLDNYDYVRLPLGIGNVRLNKGASVPLGLGGNMTLGTVRWVSKPVKVKRVRSKTTVHRKKKKGGKKNGK